MDDGVPGSLTKARVKESRGVGVEEKAGSRREKEVWLVAAEVDFNVYRAGGFVYA